MPLVGNNEAAAFSIAVTAVQTPQQEPWEMRATEVEMLFQRLRSLRKQLADEQGLAPYSVCRFL